MPEDKVIEVHKRGEFYSVKGVHNGKIVSGEIHASDVEGRGREHTEKMFQKTVKIVGQWDAQRASNEENN